MRRVILILTALTVLASASPPAADAAACKKTVPVEGKRWQYQGVGVGCKFIKKAVRAYVRDDKKPRGWSCTKTSVNGSCKKGRKIFVFQQVQRQPKG